MMRKEIFLPNSPVVLRKYEVGFASYLLEAARASCSPSFTRFAAWCHAGYDLADSEDFITQSEAHWQAASAYNFALVDTRTAELCGGIGLNQPNLVHGFYNLGYWVRPLRQRQGLAGLATRQLARAAFADLPVLQRLEILTMPDNIASQRTALAAGATREGVLRQRLRVGAEMHDALLFSLVRSDVG